MRSRAVNGDGGEVGGGRGWHSDLSWEPHEFVGDSFGGGFSYSDAVATLVVGRGEYQPSTGMGRTGAMNVSFSWRLGGAYFSALLSKAPWSCRNLMALWVHRAGGSVCGG
jgi:hypothetical protein